ncbi:MAG: hypothetical protein Q8L14_41710 [Myxococcales bacterium]|nr:hypothetical protein [Myxococcales bacterium]
MRDLRLPCFVVAVCLSCSPAMMPNTCPAPTGAGTMHGASLSTAETWTAATSPHVLPFDTSISAAITLEPCAVVTLAADKTVTVNAGGSIIANGTATQPVVIKNADGAQKWASIRLIGGTARFSYATLENGGAPLNTVVDLPGALDVRSANAATLTAPDPVLFVDHLTVKGSGSQGVRLQNGGGFSADSTSLTITGSAGHAVTSDANLVGTLPTGDYTGNTQDDILLMDNPGIRWDMTLKERGVPYLSGGINQAGVTAVGAVGAGTVAVLTIEPGVRWKFKKSTGHLSVDPGGTPSRGVLIARGTAAKPIVFTSADAAPAAGDWLGIWLGGDDPRNALDHVRIEFAGKLQSSGSNSCQSVMNGTTTNGGAVRVYHVPPSSLVTNSEFVDSATNAIDRGWRDDNKPSFLAGNTFTRIAQCKETHPRDTNGACPMPPLPCP